MLEFSNLLASLKSGIENTKSAFVKKDDMTTLRGLFLNAAESQATLHDMLNKFIVQANKLKDPSQFLQALPQAVDDVTKAYYGNEFANLLSQYFNDEPNIDEITDADIQDAFCLILSGHLNKCLMRCIAKEEVNSCHKTRLLKRSFCNIEV